MYAQLEQYSVPEWAQDLKCIPTSFVKLAQRPTPVHQWNLPGVPDGYHVSIHRDDLTGCTLSGNKIRKIEFILAEAIEQNCDCVVTCGGFHSNHCRAVAVACTQVGLECHLLLRCPGDKDPSLVQCNGNLMLDRLMGANIVLVTPAYYEGLQTETGYVPGLKDKMEVHAAKLRAEGKKPYLIPIGGSNVTGLWGHIELFRELLEQGLTKQFDDIVLPMACGGGTSIGLAVANYLTGSKLRIHAVMIEHINADEAYRWVDNDLTQLGLASKVKGRDILDIIYGYAGDGYSLFSDQDIEHLISISTSTGIILEPTYSMKTVKGMLEELQCNTTRFKGKRILYMFTGGTMGLYDQRVDGVVKQHHLTNKILGDFKSIVH